MLSIIIPNLKIKIKTKLKRKIEFGLTNNLNVLGLTTAAKEK